jgi:hypothetical protein
LVSKDPDKVRAGRAGAQKRWSNPDARRVVRLDDLSREQRAIVLALIEAARSRPTDEKVAA